MEVQFKSFIYRILIIKEKDLIYSMDIYKNLILHHRNGGIQTVVFSCQYIQHH